MGYAPELAGHALQQSRGNARRAVELCLSGGVVVPEPEPEPEPEPALMLAEPAAAAAAGGGSRRADRNENVCGRCFAGSRGRKSEQGVLLCCDGPCLLSFHPRCIGMAPADVPEGLWECVACAADEHACLLCGQVRWTAPGLRGEQQLKQGEGEGDAEVEEEDEDFAWQCSQTGCGAYYHPACAASLKHTRLLGPCQFECPAHTCHGCSRPVKDRDGTSQRCVTCAAAFHSDCLPLGCAVLTDNRMRCNQCTHNQSDDASGSAAPGDSVWCKWQSSAFSWWPALICLHSEIPDNIFALSHKEGDVCIYFFGSDEYVWLSRSTKKQFRRVQSQHEPPAVPAAALAALAAAQSQSSGQGGATDSYDPETDDDLPLILRKTAALDSGSVASLQEVYARLHGTGASGQQSSDAKWLAARISDAKQLLGEEPPAAARPPSGGGADAGSGVLAEISKPKAKLAKWEMWAKGVVEMRKLTAMLVSEQLELETSHRKPPYYQTVRRNVYASAGARRQAHSDSDEESCCLCKPAAGEESCSDEACLNRAMFVECKARSCPGGKACRNQRITKHKWSKVNAFWAGGKGWGLRAGAAIADSALVVEFTGEALDQSTSAARIARYKAENWNCLYMLALNEYIILDAAYKGSVARFINHSCDPNCTFQRWQVDGEDRLAVIALRAISRQEEITVDYKSSPAELLGQPCYCGSELCTGFIGEKLFYDSSRQGNRHGRASNKKGGSAASKDDRCFVCGDGAATGMQLRACEKDPCRKVYHRACAKAASNKKDGKGEKSAKWACPWHECNECGRNANLGCSKCPRSYCHSHGAGQKLQPFLPTDSGKRLLRVADDKSSQVAARSGGVMLCSECVDSGMDRDGEIVWARVKGHPWWPARIHREEDTNSCVKNAGQVHVRFYDDPTTTGWVLATKVRDFVLGFESGALGSELMPFCVFPHNDRHKLFERFHAGLRAALDTIAGTPPPKGKKQLAAPQAHKRQPKQPDDGKADAKGGAQAKKRRRRQGESSPQDAVQVALAPEPPDDAAINSLLDMVRTRDCLYALPLF